MKTKTITSVAKLVGLLSLCMILFTQASAQQANPTKGTAATGAQRANQPSYMSEPANNVTRNTDAGTLVVTNENGDVQIVDPSGATATRTIMRPDVKPTNEVSSVSDMNV